MKKRLFAIFAVIMSFVLGLSVFSGCNLITSDSEKDLKQVIAEINIGNDGQQTEEILKRDLVMSYLNYGYELVYNNNYTVSQAFGYLMDVLVEGRIRAQYVMKYCEENNLITDSSKAQWDLERYLTEDEIIDAKYNAIKAVNDLIDGYETPEDPLYSDTSATTARDIPTGATNVEKKLTKAEKQAYIQAGIIKGEIGSDRREAYNDALKVLQDNWLLGDSFANDDLTTSDYYKNNIESEYEKILINNYSNIISGKARRQITFDVLGAKYTEMYNAQKAKFTSASEFKTALDGATKDSPIVYAPYGGFGYVYNLLIGVTDDQAAEIAELDKDNKLAYSTERRKILQTTVATDLRSTWITSGYDFDTTNKKFTGDYTLVDSDISYPFQGDFTVLREKTDEKAGEYRIDSVREFGLDEFIAEIENYIYGQKVGAVVNDANNPAVYYKADVNDRPADYEDKINELMFAFSTDPGSLNTYKGYVVAPTPDLDGTETYMKEFAVAGRELFGMGKASFVVAATDYGYHFMFYSEIVDEVNYPTLTAYLNSLSKLNETEEYWEERYNEIMSKWDDEEFVDGLTGGDEFLYNFITKCANTNTALSKDYDAIISAYKNNEEYVKLYKNRYSDLAGN
ncbi:MAG: hypothetical protein E7362_00200 [Clostridiales bacterium]|nr:hypothetical protein [Clostridiales bacterium]